MVEHYYKHYIRVDADKNIVAAWSDGSLPTENISDAICINEQGGYQFRLFPRGEENTPLRDEYGVPLCKWDGKAVIKRTPAEIQADRPAPQLAALTLEERQAAVEAAIREMAGEIYG